MESEKHLIENEVSGPLKHLFSIELEALPNLNVVTEDSNLDNKSLKPIKKVRFSDVISQSYVDTYDDESPIDAEKTFDYNDNNENNLSDFGDQFSDLEEDDQVEIPNVEENCETLLNSTELKCSRVPYELENSTAEFIENGDVLNCEEIHDLPSDKFHNESGHLDGKHLNLCVKYDEEFEFFKENENADKVYEKDIVKEVASVCIDSNSSSIKLDAQFSDFEDSKNGKNRKKKSEFILRRIRSNENLRLQKQSEKINTLLKPYRNKFLTAPEKKSIIFEAWNSVKKKDVKNVLKEQIKEEISSHCYKYTPKDQQSIQKKIKLRKKKKELSKETKKLLNDVQQRMSKEDMEEKEMAFKSWKKNKEEIIKQHVKLDNEKKQQQKWFILRDEQLKKENAESAYLSWKAHKEEISKKERMKINWLKQKDNEANDLKIQQNERALELYSIWLENKHCGKNNNFSLVEDRPAWLPPGKAKLK